MKYFVKYLLNEPKNRYYAQDHRILTKDGRLGRITSIGIDTGMYFIELDDGTTDYDEMIDWDFVSPFLCSREIEVDDEVTVEWENGDIETKKKVIMIEDDGKTYHFSDGWCYKELAYKVLGEISPEASWVKEGDEFDEYSEQFYYQVNEKWFKLSKKDYHLNTYETEEVKLTYKLKGPCGYFH